MKLIAFISAFILFVSSLVVARVYAQSASPTPSPSPSASATAVPSAAPRTGFGTVSSYK